MTDERRNILHELIAASMEPDPSGEYRSRYPGTIIACCKPWGHTGEHASPPGEWHMTWPNDMPIELGSRERR